MALYDVYALADNKIMEQMPKAMLLCKVSPLTKVVNNLESLCSLSGTAHY